MAKQIKRAQKAPVKKAKKPISKTKKVQGAKIYKSDLNVIFCQQASDIPENLQKIKPGNIFEAAIFPMKPAQFFKSIYQKKAFVIKAQPKGRFSSLKEDLSGLKLADMLEDITQEDTVQMWRPAKGAKERAIHVGETDDAVEALKAYKRGASLYFTSSAFFRDSYGKALGYHMGHDFAGYFPGSSTLITAGDPMTEIEVFVGRKGNYTDWHTDFQENFTFQLKGSKKWRLRTEPGMEAPIMGFSPHYAEVRNLEAQTKGIRCYNGVDIGVKYDKARLKRESTSVTLNEGDIMYHPAGIWHSVESITDSIAINFSMRHVRNADFIINTLRQHLLKDVNMRKGIRFSEDDPDNKKFFTELKEGFQKASKFLGQVKPEPLLPPTIHIPRAMTIDLDEDNIEMLLRPENPRRPKVGQTLQISQHFIMTDLKTLPQHLKEATAGAYSVNGMFGTENLESTSRVKITTDKDATKKLCDRIMKLQLANSKASIKVTKAALTPLTNLVWQGVLHFP